jgi:Icc-related predicted phosphoesterase
MKIVVISDTHNQHPKLVLPEGDLIIHAGDISENGTNQECLEFLQWFSQLPFKHKVFIAGNHDFMLERASNSQIEFPEGVIYLRDSACEIEGLRIYGSPYTPEFYNWAFMKKRGAEIRKVWENIPSKLDILVTHGPPFKVLDRNLYGVFTGCEDLLERVKEVKPKIHAFGHIHESYGTIEENGIKFINASSLNINYKLANKPVEIDL